MTDAPERIWATVDIRGIGRSIGSWVDKSPPDDSDEYIRADLVPKWQPIETAPRDGSSFLAWYPTPPMCVDAWDVRRTWWAPEDGRWDTTDMTVDPHDPEAPTHWMPIPEPPIMETTDDMRRK